MVFASSRYYPMFLGCLGVFLVFEWVGGVEVKSLELEPDCWKTQLKIAELHTLELSELRRILHTSAQVRGCQHCNWGAALACLNLVACLNLDCETSVEMRMTVGVWKRTDKAA